MTYKNFSILIISIFALLVIGVSLIVSQAKIPKLDIPSIMTSDDMDSDGISDIQDMLAGARSEIQNKTNYHSAYYSGGYPPESEGVCSDVIWRALQEMGYNLKDALDDDISKNIQFYPRVEGAQDRNIDFRRVPNLQVYFQRHHESLTLEVIPGDIENLKLWQPGDIVIFRNPKDHIAIISDKRNSKGVPYIIHNSAPTPREDDWLEYWNNEISPIAGHYRIVKNWDYITR